MKYSVSVRLLWIGVLCVLLESFYGAYALMPTEGAMDHTSSVWIAQALDAAQGSFYRPANGPDGFGGTRYFPVQVVLQALLIKCGLSPIASGYEISTISLLLLMVGAAFLLRAYEFSWSVAIPIAALALGAEPIQKVWLGPRGDILPVAFNLMGMALCIDKGTLSNRNSRLAVAGLLFGCAVATKATAVFGLLGMAGAYALTKSWKPVLIISGAFFLCAALILGVANWASEGRLLTIFFQTATQGMSLAAAIFVGFHYLVFYFNYGSAFGLALFMAAIATLIFTGKTSWRDPLALALCGCFLITSLILASPGTYFNQLVVLFIISMLYFAVSWRALNLPWAILFLATLGFIAGIRNIGWHNDRVKNFNRASTFESILKVIGPGDQPILAEDPIIPIKEGKRPYMLDPFMYRYLSLRDPSLNQRLLQDVENKHFRAVVFIRDPASPKNDSWYANTHFGSSVIQCVSRNYSPIARFDDYVVLKPNRSVE